ncbi:MAG: type IV secretory system conjugative DNA transfer family protein [Methylobacterium sp.]|nr:type IV secretory system conjugative DNA transfer family protein [Methylobacterium sp.]MCA3607197.1 type IV secretory system conjugative DNA transfer family protein [Methylobacterium sp.]MCA3610741.1 type IV secretory system conjugative DNA transfer family protein [Methylobacterium sp.]MCA3619381.1 type IV secretory system conjugative DNA transfer family protein [Methylobacterium sp.]MCA3622529.1 type IV secretory system conjugative DNA transfer family protein [Methylobacterium sp.]
MPEAGQEPDDKGPLLTPRGKAVVRKVALLPLWPAIWVGRAIWAQHDRLYAWTTKAWETRHQQPAAKTFGEAAGRIALWPLHAYFALGRALARRIEVWWKGTPPSEAPPAAPPATPSANAETATSLTGRLKASAIGAFETTQRAFADWQAKRDAERAAEEKRAAEERAAAAAAAAKVAVPAKATPKRIELNEMPNDEWLEQFLPEDRGLAAMIQCSPIIADQQKFWLNMLIRGERDVVKRWFVGRYLPELPGYLKDELLAAGGGRGWATLRDLEGADLIDREDADREGPVVVGEVEVEDGQRADIVFDGEGHLLTVAMTGGGKTQVHVLPNVLEYMGPVVALDPKGEIYRWTGRVRRGFGPVYPWAPFDDDIKSASFNPLDFVKEWEDAQSLSALLVPDGEKKDAFWNLSSRRLLTAFIYYCAKYEDEGCRNLQRALDLMVNPKAPTSHPRQYKEDGSPLLRIEHVYELFVATGDPNLVAAADSLMSFMNNENHLSSFISIAQNELEPWKSPRIAAVTQRTSHDWDPAFMWRVAFIADLGASQGEVVGDGQFKMSVFLIVPPEYIKPFASVLRIIIGFHIREMLKAARDSHAKTPTFSGLPRHPVLFMLDELPQLGYIDQIETAITIVRSARLRFWLFAQDIAQLRRIYPGWETMLANCRAKMFYAINDQATADHVSEFLGEHRDPLSGQGRPLAPPGELLHPKLAGQEVLFIKGVQPIRAFTVPFRHKPWLVKKVEEARATETRPDFDEPVVGTVDTSPSDRAQGESPTTHEAKGSDPAATLSEKVEKKRGSKTRRRSVSDTTKKSTAAEPPETDEPTFVDLVEQNWASRPRKPDPN